MRTLSTLLTPCILTLLCACTPDSNNIGETVTASETDSTASDPSDGVTDGGSGSTTTAGDETTTGDATTGAIDETTGDGTTGDSTTTGETSTTGETTTDGTTTDGTTTDGTTTDGTTGGADPFTCGKMTCDANTQYCSVFVPGVMDAEIQYGCELLPERCGDTPDCACLPDDDPCQCAEDDGLTFTCYGA
jgi:hypothetical protein